MSADSDEAEDEMVWIGGQHSKRYHLDRDCPTLKQTTRVIEKSRSDVEIFKKLCRFCSGEASCGTKGGRGLRNQLLKANPEDYGLSPLTERDPDP